MTTGPQNIAVFDEYVAAEAAWNAASEAVGSDRAAAARRYVGAIDEYIADLRAVGFDSPVGLDTTADALRARFGAAVFAAGQSSRAPRALEGRSSRQSKLGTAVGDSESLRRRCR
jgi:hypothetical protein